MITDVLSLPKDIRMKLLKIRAALIKEDKDEAFHIIYSIADPSFMEKLPWKDLEESVEKEQAKTKEMTKLEKYHLKKGKELLKNYIEKGRQYELYNISAEEFSFNERLGFIGFLAEELEKSRNRDRKRW